MNKKHRGEALIISVNEVKDMKERTGTDMDCYHLKQLWRALQFNVTVFTDDDGLTAVVKS